MLSWTLTEIGTDSLKRLLIKVDFRDIMRLQRMLKHNMVECCLFTRNKKKKSLEQHQLKPHFFYLWWAVRVTTLLWSAKVAIKQTVVTHARVLLMAQRQHPSCFHFPLSATCPPLTVNDAAAPSFHLSRHTSDSDKHGFIVVVFYVLLWCSGQHSRVVRPLWAFNEVTSWEP